MRKDEEEPGRSIVLRPGSSPLTHPVPVVLAGTEARQGLTSRIVCSFEPGPWRFDAGAGV